MNAYLSCRALPRANLSKCEASFLRPHIFSCIVQTQLECSNVDISCHDLGNQADQNRVVFLHGGVQPSVSRFNWRPTLRHSGVTRLPQLWNTALLVLFGNPDGGNRCRPTEILPPGTGPKAGRGPPGAAPPHSDGLVELVFPSFRPRRLSSVDVVSSGERSGVDFSRFCFTTFLPQVRGCGWRPGIRVLMEAECRTAERTETAESYPQTR